MFLDAGGVIQEVSWLSHITISLLCQYSTIHYVSSQGRQNQGAEGAIRPSTLSINVPLEQKIQCLIFNLSARLVEKMCTFLICPSTHNNVPLPVSNPQSIFCFTTIAHQNNLNIYDKWKSWSNSRIICNEYIKKRTPHV